MSADRPRRRGLRRLPAHLLAATLVTATLLTATLAGWLLPRLPAAAAEAVTETSLTVAGTPETDGVPVDLDVTLLTTDPATPQPAVVLAHGFGGTKTDSLPVARELALAGYTVLVYTARGFGASGGRIHLDDPAYEGADAVRVVDLAATRPEVASRDGDPVVGFAGASYGGAVALVAAGLDPRIDAVVPAFTWNSLVQSLFPQHVVSGPARSLADLAPVGPGVFKQRWASLFFLSGSAGGPAARPDGAAPDAAGEEALCGRFDLRLCRAYLRTAERGRPDAELLRLLERSGPAAQLGRVTAPTLLIQGEQDTLFPLDQADANLRGLPSTTTARMLWVEGGHDASVSVLDSLVAIQDWFDRYLRADGSPTDTSFRVTVPQTALVDRGDDESTTLVAGGYPGRGVAPASDVVGLAGGSQRVVSPPGGTPAALTSLPGTGAALSAVAGVAGYGLGVLPGRSATFTSAPLPAPRALVGAGRVQLEVTSSTETATLFVSLWDLGPEVTPATGAPAETEPSGPSAAGPRPSTAVLPGAAVSPVRLTGLRPGRPEVVEVALPAVAHQVPVDHRLQVVVSSTDQAYAVPPAPAVYTVALAGDPALSLPLLTAEIQGGGGLRVSPVLAAVVAALGLAALGSLLVSRSRRRARQSRPDLAHLPLAVDGLVKTYRDGFRAVDGVSFTAAPGQVVGLLGPNGAGKTTTMRMLVGLIRPDAGAIYVGGEPVHAGSEVLGSVGAFIEGPGFLPHLTGAENLAAFWAATGRPPEEAHLAEALEIAGLGSGLDRRVRGYSQGMRQRLGIAQAMLGRPQLLLLDEPTNGLDPPQILAMRSVLADYAATGRTVLVSSHLLAEVEHTCTEVVVMNRGRVVLTGSVAELTASDDVTLVGLAPGADVEAARRALSGLGLAVALEDGLLRVAGERPRADIVAALVAAGVGVESVDGRRRLEEVFMGLVGVPGSGGAAGAEPLGVGDD